MSRLFVGLSSVFLGGQWTFRPAEVNLLTADADTLAPTASLNCTKI